MHRWVDWEPESRTRSGQMASIQCRLTGFVSSILILLRRTKSPHSNRLVASLGRPVPWVPALQVLKVLSDTGHRPRWVYRSYTQVSLVPDCGTVALCCGVRTSGYAHIRPFPAGMATRPARPGTASGVNHNGLLVYHSVRSHQARQGERQDQLTPDRQECLTRDRDK